MKKVLIALGVTMFLASPVVMAGEAAVASSSLVQPVAAAPAAGVSIAGTVVPTAVVVGGTVLATVAVGFAASAAGDDDGATGTTGTTGTTP